MSQLYTKASQSFQEWSSGSALFLSHHIDGSHTYRIAIKCRLGNLDVDDLALLDTGAEWSVIGLETAELIADDLGSPIASFPMSTRLGNLEGSLYPISITLLAEKGCGQDVMVDGTVFVAKDWVGPTVLGYRGFLERLRIAIDPGVRPHQERFFFGRPE